MIIARTVVGLLALAAACGGSPREPVGLPPEPPAEPVLVGDRSDLSTLRWLDPSAPFDLTAHRLTLLRWWTVQCPFCLDSLPALGELRRRFGEDALGLVGVFHPKSTIVPTDAQVIAYARELGFGGAIASDDRWRALEQLRERYGLDAATSISVLVDGDGVVQWVHPGPRLHRSDDSDMAEADRSFRELEALLAARLR